MKSCKPEWKPDIRTARRLGVGISIGSGIPFALHDLLQLSCISCSYLVILVVTYPVFSRVSDPDPQDPHVFALPGSGQKGKEMNE